MPCCRWWLPRSFLACRTLAAAALDQITVSGDRLRYETGMAAKSTRTIQLSKLQDVRVDQGIWQRILSIGDLSLETSGETSRLTIRNIDNAQAVADELTNRSQAGPTKA